MNHIVPVSGGKDSTATAVGLNEFEPRPYQYVFTPTGNELPEVYDHIKKLEDVLNATIQIVTSGKSLQGLIRKYNALPNWRQRWCTRELKIEVFNSYLKEHSPAISYVGLRADEPESVRRGMVLGNVEGITQRYPLREWGWGINEVWDYLDVKGITIPERTDCAWCFFQRGAEWWRLWKNHPETYAQAEQQEELTGYTFRSPGGHKDRHPVSLKDLRIAFENGTVPKGALPKNSDQLALFDTRQFMCRACSL